MDPETTQNLQSILEKARTTEELDAFLHTPGQVMDISFAAYYTSLPQVQAIGHAELIRRSCIERTYFYQLMNGRRRPGRDKVISLCLCAGLDLKETNRCLRLAGLAPLYSRNKRDAILIYGISQNIDFSEVNLLLLDFGESVLDTNRLEG